MRSRYGGLKRLMDVVAAAGLLAGLSPVLMAIWVAAAVGHGRPVLFRQWRPGLNGVPFLILKFRTMRLAAPGSDPIEDDGARITPLGRFLRATSLDELPELWNVLRGEMSLVGPRPLLVDYLPLYTPEQMRRHDVRPGVTGLAQVSGRNAIEWEEKFRLDVFYVENRTMLMDLGILWLTVWKVLRREAISAEGHATVPAFKGSPSDGAARADDA